MLVDQVRLMDFRGSRANLTVDLNVPLTVLYAVNGTGKTTLCDALEWLLTGEVRRLADTDPQYCNWFNEREETARLVEADLNIDQQTVTVGRTRAGVLKTKNPQDRWVNQIEPEFLRQIMGHEIAAASTVERNKAQKEWIQTAHFFDGQGLDAIVDPTPEGRLLRRRAFSSLFGVGTRQQQRADLWRLLQKMTPTWLEAGVDEANRALSERQYSLVEGERKDLDALRLELTDRIKSAEEKEGTEASSDSLTTGRVEVLRLRAKENLHNLKQAMEAETLVRERYGRVLSQREVLSKARADAEGYSTHLDSLLAQQPTIEANLVRERGRKMVTFSANERIHDASKRLPTVRTHLLEALGRWRWSRDSSLMGGDELASLVATSKSQFASLRERREAWQRCLSRCADWAKTRNEELQSIELAKIAQQQLDSLRARDQIEHEIFETQRDLGEIQTELKNTGGVLARFRNEASTLLAGLKDESDCPLCGHTFGSQDSLRRAIANRLETEPATIAGLAARLQVIADRLTQLNLELAAHNAAVDKLNIATSRTQEKRATTDEAISELAVMGLPPESIDRSDLAGLLSQQLEKAKKLEADGSQKFAEITDFQEVSSSLREIALALTDIQEVITASEIGSILDHPIGKWEGWCEALAAFMGQQIDKVIQSDRLVAESTDLAESALKNLRDQVELTTDLRNRTRAEVIRLEKWIQEWTSALTQFGLAGEPSSQEIELKAASTHKAYEASEEFSEILTALSEEVTAYLQREKGEEDIKRLREAVEFAEARAHHRRQWFEGIQKAVEMLDERQSLDIAAQVGPLRNTIRAIFGRSQAHEVIDQVDVVPRNDGSLDWKVNIGTHEECEMRVLSRGQRQDLALSVFLARAVGIGGTVFMDEPLLHLDDLNRVGLLDTLRVIAQEHGERVRVVMTTADRMLVRHFREKFDLLSAPSRRPLLQIITLTGNPRDGVRASVEPVVRKEIYDDVALFPPGPQMQ